MAKKKKKKNNIVAEVGLDGTITKLDGKSSKNNNLIGEVGLDGTFSKYDIAPVKKATKKKEEEEKKNTWFSKGSYEDGFSLKNTFKSNIATTQDVTENITTGVLKVGEGIMDLGAYAVGGISKLFGADEFADKTKKFIATNHVEEYKLGKAIAPFLDPSHGMNTLLNYVVNKGQTDENSLLGEKSDSLVQSAGQLAATIGLQTVGVPWWLTTGTTSFGSGTEEAFKNNATYGEAGAYGLISAGAEVLTEKLSGGISFGGKTLDDTLLKPLTNKIANKTIQTLTKFGMDVVGEGTEEVITEVITNVGKKLTYEDEKTWSELLTSEEAMESYLDAFIGGSVMGGGFNAGRTYNSIRTGRDYDTGLSTNEQKVIDKEVENRIAEREKNGNKLTNKEKTKIQEQVKEELQKGYIDIDTIESTLGGETYNQYKSITDKKKSLESKINKLESKKNADITVKEFERLQKLRKEYSELDTDTLKNKLSSEVDSLTKSDFLLRNSYNEKANKSVKFDADVSKYDVKQQKIVKKAIESGILNNTNKTHDFVDMIAKLSADKGVDFDFTNNEKLKNSGFVLEGKTVNGFVSKNGITLNIDSNNALNKVVGHEITHVLEGTELYTELQQAVKEYATTKGVYDTRLKELTELYKDVDDANIENELTSDLVGEYLFTDTDFVNNLSATKPNVFKKIYNEIKYLLKVATAGSKEARQLEKVKKTFDKAYKQNASNTIGNEVKYSLREDTKHTKEELEKYVFNDEFYDRFKYENKDKITKTIEELQQEKELIDPNESDEAYYKHYSLRTQIEALEKGYESEYDLIVGKEKERLTKDYEYGLLDKKIAEKKKMEVEQNQLQNEIEEATPLQREQYNIIQKYNPAPEGSNYVWIRTPKDIKTFAEVVNDEDSFVWGDYSREDALNDLERNRVVIYSSYPIKQGVFVSTSKIQAQEYAGGEGNFVYSKQVRPESVAWINGDEGQYAKVPESKLSLSNQNEQIAPTGNYNVYGSDIKLQVEEAIAPLQETITELTEQVETLKEELAPVKDEYAALTEADLPTMEQQYSEAPKEDVAPIRNNLTAEESQELDSLENLPFDLDADEQSRMAELQEKENPSSPVEEKVSETKDLFETRDYAEVGDRKVKAYQYDNPEVKPYFQDVAKDMLDDLNESIKGERFVVGDISQLGGGDYSFSGQSRFTTPDIAELLDGMDGKYKLSYEQIRKGLENIIKDEGAENNAASKRIEFYLDKRLREGYTTMYGFKVDANQEYLNTIEGVEYNNFASNLPFDDSLIPPEAEDTTPPVESASNTEVVEENAPIKEVETKQEAQQPVEENKNLTIKESNALKLNNLEKSLERFNNDAKQSLESFNELILEKKRQYSALSNRNTQSANKLLQQINRLTTQRDNTQVEYERRMNNIQKRIDKMNSKEFKVAEQRQTKQQEYRQLARELIGDTSTWKDKKMGIQYQINTMKRNLRDIIKGVDGKADTLTADLIYNEYFRKYDENQAKVNREANAYKQKYEDLKINAVEHEYIQMLGEFRHNPETKLTEDRVQGFLNKHKSKIDEQKVEKAIEYAKKDYDELFNRINERLKAQGIKELPYREGYFPHFIEEKQGFLGKLFDWKTVNDEIPTDIAGLTELNNPEKSWQSFNKHRTGDTTTYNFGKGFDTYLSGALDWIHHIEDIQKIRALENEIRYQHSEKGVKEQIENIYNDTTLDADEVQERIDGILSNSQNPLNNFVTDLRNWTNNVAGKKSTMDRSLEYATNRKIYSTMTNISNRVSGNMIGGSISSALTNFIPITQSWGTVSPVSSLRAMKDTIAATIKDDGFINKSTFLTNRLNASENLYKSNWDKVNKGVGVLFDGIDSFVAQTITRSKYIENIENGMSEDAAMRNADQFAKDVIGGRSKGDMPTIFNSKNPMTKLFTAFQLEVNNQYAHMFKDMPTEIGSESKGKLIKGYATMFVGAYLYNALYSALVGRDAAFDPIGLIEEILKTLRDEEEEPEEKFATIFEETVKQVPFVGGLFGGGRLPISSAIPYENPIGMITGTVEDGIKAFGGDEKALKDLTSEWLKPLTYLALPFGGGQIKKTIEGLSMYDDDLPVKGSYTNNGDLRFPVEDTPLNRIQSALFGKWANENAKEYIEEGRTPLKENQIKEFADLDMPISDYWEYRDGLKKAGQTTDAKGYAKYLDEEGNVYWYDKDKKVLYNSEYKKSNKPVVDLEKANKIEQIYNYITGLDVTDKQKGIMFNNVSKEASTDKYGYQKYTNNELNKNGEMVTKTYWYDEDKDVLYDSKYNVVDSSMVDYMQKVDGAKDLSNYNQYGGYDEFNFATKNEDKYNFLQNNNVSYEEYLKNKKGYDWAYENPEDYEVVKQIDTIENYMIYKDYIGKIKEQYSTNQNLTSKQKTALSKQRKAAVQQYIESLNLSIPQKVMLEKMAGGYSIKDYENYMFQYIESLPMSASEKQALHSQLFD